MNWDDYRFFLSLARSGRLSAAAKLLGVDHATVSRRVRALEEALDTKLFDRSPGGYALTAAGQDLIAMAEQMESGVIQAENAVGGQRESLSGSVRIGVPEGVAAYIVVEAAQKLCERYAKLEVQLIALPRRFSLSKREADFVVAVSRPETGRLKIQKIADYKLHLYATQAYLDQHPPVRDIAALQSLRGIGYVPELIFDKALDYIPLVDPAFRPRLTSTSVHVQLQAVLNGAGVGIVHDFMARRYPELHLVLPQKVSFTRSFWGVVHEDYAQIERIRVCSAAIIEHMREVLRDG
uniref:LysR family transcriptional regulator n=1 Tax=Pararhizobium sp. IMCC3301 TaxID=3067904 RepID=UPI002740A414|nr:LysR family transcriptional regulator [Pararhizobium sp. IMCC3301]